MAEELEQSESRNPPSADVSVDGSGAWRVVLDGDWERIKEAARNTGAVTSVVQDMVRLGAEGENHNKAATDYAIGFVDGMEPRDPAELLLLTQMAATHQAVMMLARHLNHTKTIQQKDCAEKAFNKTARTFASQMEALKRYRSKGQQVVRVERVTVEAGAQAVVGNVERGRGADET